VTLGKDAETMNLARHAFDLGAPRDYRLTTAEILYHMPDHPSVLQTFIWQDLDIAPQYPMLNKFLDFWRKEIEGSLHSVRVATADIGQRGKLWHADTLLRLH
jgi:uncharacterized protein Usg